MSTRRNRTALRKRKALRKTLRKTLRKALRMQRTTQSGGMNATHLALAETTRKQAANNATIAAHKATDLLEILSK